MADLARAKQIAVTVLAVVRDGLAPFEYGDIYNRASLAGASIPRRIDMLTTADRLIGDIDRPEAAVLPWPLNSAEMAGEAAAIALIANNLWMTCSGLLPSPRQRCKPKLIRSSAAHRPIRARPVDYWTPFLNCPCPFKRPESS
jgi:hypothetical protein